MQIEYYKFFMLCYKMEERLKKMKEEKLTYKMVKESKEVNAFIEKGNETLGIIGFTEHSRKHAAKVAETSGKILETLGYDEHLWLLLY